MKMSTRSVATGFAISALLFGGIGLAPAAMAAPMGGSADETIEWLQSEGYDVRVSGGPSQGSSSQCVATNVHGLRGTNIDDDGRQIDDTQHHVATVELNCNDTV